MLAAPLVAQHQTRNRTKATEANSVIGTRKVVAGAANGRNRNRHATAKPKGSKIRSKNNSRAPLAPGAPAVTIPGTSGPARPRVIHKAGAFLRRLHALSSSASSGSLTANAPAEGLDADAAAALGASSAAEGGDGEDADGEELYEYEELSAHSLAALAAANLSADTSDPDPVMRNPFLDSRHTFLEMCQYRHYQFDTLRRAKHSSLMLLYHLHHPDAPSTRPACTLCGGCLRDVRWHCDVCVDFDICEACYPLAAGSAADQAAAAAAAELAAVDDDEDTYARPTGKKTWGASAIPLAKFVAPAAETPAAAAVPASSSSSGGGGGAAAEGKRHPHLLTPWRITYLHAGCACDDDKQAAPCGNSDNQK